MSEDFAGNTLGTAKALELTSSLQTFTGSVNPLDTTDYYGFNLSNHSSLSMTLSGLGANADLELLNSGGEVLQTSAQLGTSSESLFTTLDAGSYYIKVSSNVQTSTNYNLNLSAIPDRDTITGFSNPNFDTGVFTVGSNGQVGIDYLFDGGWYQSELAIFSLEGMEQFETDLNQFIAEASRRALSNSDFGHVVISDATEGARFHGSFPWEPDYNSGEYLGVSTFSMRPGDTFGVMLVPNGTVQQVSDNPGVEGAIRPLFSLSTSNPNNAFHLGQIADVNGKGNTFTMEDLRVDSCSDKDYNDIIFQVRGATGQAVKLDQVIDSTKDWRSTDLGKNLMGFIKPPENQPLIGVIDTGLNPNNPDINPFHVHLGHDYVAGDGNPLLQPDKGSEHGTHITGIIAATQDNGTGIDGINDQAPIYVTRATGSEQWAQALTEIVDAAKESGQPNAIANLSLDLTQVNPDGSVTTRYEFTPEERAALEYARQNHVLIVAAAGNDGGVMSVLGQASREFDNIITVGAAQPIDVGSISQPSGTISQAFERVNYSSYGYGLDIVAPGGTIENPVLSTVGDGVGTMAGTSVATAQVTGAASLAWAENPELSYRQVIDILKSTAIDLETVGWDPQTGAGLLDTEAAVNLARTTTPEPYTPESFSTPTTWSGEGEVLPTERAVWTTAEIGQQPTGGSYASGYIPPWQSSATLTQDWNSNFSHVGNSAYAKDWVIADRNVSAAKAGTVVYVKQDSTTYGNNPAYANDANYVIIRHDDGYESLYLHLEAGSVPVSVGDHVQAGTYIGTTGLSGWTTGEHLHFAVRNPNTRSSVPFLFDGTPVTGNQPIQTPNSSEVWLADFSASVMADPLANVRSGAGTNYEEVPYGSPPYGISNGTLVEFDAWTYGETITDIALGTPDARWYRIKGTKDWISSAIVNGNAPGSMPLPLTNPNSPNGFTVGGDLYTVWQQYLGTLGNPISGVSSHSSGATYQLFDNGSIVNSQYGTFPLYGAIRQTYLDTGGLNGWLGVPISAEVGQGNGVIKQTFDNGYIIWNGSRATAYQYGSGVVEPVVEESVNNQPRSVELVDPTQRYDWLTKSEPDFNKYWTPPDKSTFDFNELSWMQFLPVPENLGFTTVGQRAQEAEDFLLNLFPPPLYPNANKHMRHFLTQGMTPQKIENIPVNEMLKVVDGFEEEYEKRKKIVEDLVQKMVSEIQWITTGEYWINPEDKKIMELKREDGGEWLRKYDDDVDEKTPSIFRSQGINIQPKYINPKYDDFYYAIGKFDLNTPMKVNVSYSPSGGLDVSISSQVLVHDYFNFDMFNDDKIEESIDKRIGRIAGSAVPEILVGLGMANNYEQSGASSWNDLRIV